MCSQGSPEKHIYYYEELAYEVIEAKNSGIQRPKRAGCVVPMKS